LTKTIEQMLDDARAGLMRLAPEDAQEALEAGAALIDIRSEAQRARDGVVPGSTFVARNVLEWRLAPQSAWRDPALARAGAGALVMLMCDDGYQSSLAAATLQELGLERATDEVGGFQAWRAAGLPVSSARDGQAEAPAQ
jgi:rhodanese-related sulfurtransferase